MEQRELADYEPSAIFQPSYVTTIIDLADVAIDSFSKVQPDEKTDVLSYMMVSGRS